MLIYVIYILIISILVFVFVIAIKSLKRGIEAKQKLHDDVNHKKNKKYNNEKN